MPPIFICLFTTFIFICEKNFVLIFVLLTCHFTLSCDWVGYFSYDTVRYVEKRKVPFSMAPKDERNLADIHLGLYDDVLLFDHVEKKVYVIHWVRLDRYSSIEMAYEDGVKHLASLLAGVQSLTPRTFADPFEIYRALRVVNPSPYMTHLQARGCILVASSPEILTRVNKLLSNEKQCAEHIMLVDLGQNDVGKMVSAFIDEFSHLSVLFLMPCHATPCYSTLHSALQYPYAISRLIRLSTRTPIFPGAAHKTFLAPFPAQTHHCSVFSI
ncbi:hypothetical protein UlMin_013678 [Ulmus minor]